MEKSKIEALNEVLAQNPDDAFARYGLAMEYKQLADYQRAIEQFDELRKRCPDYTAGYQMAAQVLIDQGKTEEAVERLHEGIESAGRTGNRHALSEMEAMLDEIQERT